MYGNLEVKVWMREGYRSQWTFTKKPRDGDWGYKFLKYIQLCKNNGWYAARVGFLSYLGAPVRPGYMSSFFASILQAGIVTAKRGGSGTHGAYRYDVGPNASAYLNGSLCCLVRGWEVGYSNKNPKHVLILGESLRDQLPWALHNLGEV